MRPESPGTLMRLCRDPKVSMKSQVSESELR